MMVVLFAFLFTASCAFAESGLASFYGEEQRGRKMANGHPFDPNAMTCASWRHPLGAKLEVRNSVGDIIVVVVTDRGPHKRYRLRVIDLSAAAFSHLAGLELGLVPVTIRRLK